MIWTIISLAVLVVGIVCAIVWYYTGDDTWGIGAVPSGLVGGIFSILCISLVLSVNTPFNKRRTKIELDNRIAEIEADKQLILTLKDDYARSVAITNYNNKVKEFKVEVEKAQYDLNNPFVNWFTCPVYNEYDSSMVDYIISVEIK